MEAKATVEGDKDTKGLKLVIVHALHCTVDPRKKAQSSNALHSNTQRSGGRQRVWYWHGCSAVRRNLQVLGQDYKTLYVSSKLHVP